MIERYQRDIESFSQRMAEIQYLERIGQRMTQERESIYSDCSDLFRAETISELKTAEEATPDFLASGKKSCRRLLGFVMRHRLKSATLEFDRALDAQECDGSIIWEGLEISYREAQHRLGDENDRERRLDLCRRLQTKAKSLFSIWRERWKAYNDAVRSLGYDCGLALHSCFSIFPFVDVAKSARKLLDETRDAYEAQLSVVLRRSLGIEVREAHYSDLSYFSRLNCCAEFFLGSRLTQAYGETMDRLGVDVARQKHLHIHAGIESIKRPSASCIALKIPQDIRLVVSPRGGADEYAHFMHEGGRGQHYAWTSASLPVENRYCGDQALGMIYGFLFRDLVCDSQWLLDRLGFGESLGFIRQQGLIHLLAARLSAACALLEIELQQADISEEDRLAVRYAELLTEASLFRHDEDSFLPAISADLEAVNGFRAHLIAPHLREYLRRRYARCWYQDARTGNLLKELWETGVLFTAEELAGELGMRFDDIQPWKDDLLSCLIYD